MGLPGFSAAWRTAPSTAEAPWRTIAAPMTAQPGDRLSADTSAGSFTLTLPANAAEGTAVSIADPEGTWGAKPLTVAGNGRLFDDGTADLLCDDALKQITLVVRGGIWRF